MKVYNRENINEKGKIGKPFISFSEVNGTISFSPDACKIIGIKEGMQVQFLQGDDPTEWYVESVFENGFILNKYGETALVTITAMRLVREIFTSCGAKKTYNRCPVGEILEYEGRKLHTIVTAAIK